MSNDVRDGKRTWGFKPIHGQKGTPTYKSWIQMRRRCNQTTDPHYPNYGGRGIAVCARWDDFALFLADMGARPDGMSIDRIDNDGDYEPGNCRWATKEEQNRNKRHCYRISINGECMTAEEWGRRYGVYGSAITKRIRNGITPQDAVAQAISAKRGARA
jgi:predicted DNA-binding WGR domain protein